MVCYQKSVRNKTKRVMRHYKNTKINKISSYKTGFFAFFRTIFRNFSVFPYKLSVIIAFLIIFLLSFC